MFTTIMPHLNNPKWLNFLSIFQLVIKGIYETGQYVYQMVQDEVRKKKTSGEKERLEMAGKIG